MFIYQPAQLSFERLFVQDFQMKYLEMVEFTGISVHICGKWLINKCRCIVHETYFDFSVVKLRYLNCIYFRDYGLWFVVGFLI